MSAPFLCDRGTLGGRPPFDPVMMFKILVIQTTNNLSLREKGILTDAECEQEKKRIFMEILTAHYSISEYKRCIWEVMATGKTTMLTFRIEPGQSAACHKCQVATISACSLRSLWNVDERGI